MFHLLDDLRSFLIFLKHSINNTLLYHDKAGSSVGVRSIAMNVMCVCLSVCQQASYHHHIFVYLEVDKRNSYKLYKYTDKGNRKMVND